MESRSATDDQPGFSSRLQQWWQSIPLVTFCLVLLCCCSFVMTTIAGPDALFTLCMSPAETVSDFEVFRAFTSVFVHVNLLHLALNMLVLLPYAIYLERALGSLRFAHSISLFAVTNTVIHCGLAYAAAGLSYPLGNYGLGFLVQECVVGISGIIFSLIVLEVLTSGAEHQSMFGLKIPSAWYPWALLLLCQVLMPHVSLLGHLSGILSGYAYAHSFFERVTPSPSTLSHLENMGFMPTLVRLPGFTPGGSPPSFPTGTNQQPLLPMGQAPGLADPVATNQAHLQQAQAQQQFAAHHQEPMKQKHAVATVPAQAQSDLPVENASLLPGGQASQSIQP